jgi:type II secretory pathway component PulF
VSRFARVFGLCISSGVSLIEAIHLGGRASGSAALEAETDRVVKRVKSGDGLTEALRSSNEIPPFAKRMLAAGEASGELPRMASVVARHHERETAVATKYLTTVLEPVLVVMVAGVVLVVALAVFLPMWDLVTLLG